MANYKRPQIPYDSAESLPYNNRYDLIAANNQPPTAQQLDGDLNYLIDAANDLYGLIERLTVGVLPGANDPTNVNKFPTTDGNEDDPTISWTLVQDQNIDDGAISTDKIQDGAVTTDQLGEGSVTSDKIYPEAVGNQQLAEDSVNTDELIDNAVTTPKIAAGAVGTTQISDNAVATAKIADGAVTTAKIADGAIETAKIANNAVTNAQLAVIAQIPVGGLIDFGGTVIPTGWLSCIGQAVRRDTYAALFTAIGIAYGSGDGVNTFNVPDFRGRVSVGLDSTQAGNANATAGRVVTTQSGGWVNGGNGGAETITLNATQIPSHTHDFQIASAPSILAAGGSAAQVFYQNNTAQTSAIGGGLSHPNMPPYLFVGKIIYAGV